MYVASAHKRAQIGYYWRYLKQLYTINFYSSPPSVLQPSRDSRSSRFAVYFTETKSLISKAAPHLQVSASASNHLMISTELQRNDSL